MGSWSDDKRNQHFYVRKAQNICLQRNKRRWKKNCRYRKKQTTCWVTTATIISEIPENQQCRPNQQILVTPIRLRSTGANEAQ